MLLMSERPFVRKAVVFGAVGCGPQKSSHELVTMFLSNTDSNRFLSSHLRLVIGPPHTGALILCLGKGTFLFYLLCLLCSHILILTGETTQPSLNFGLILQDTWGR